MVVCLSQWNPDEARRPKDECVFAISSFYIQIHMSFVFSSILFLCLF